jgi:hypothetical protein
METKVCCRCKIQKNTCEFRVDRKNTDNLFSWCRECTNKRRGFLNSLKPQVSLPSHIINDLKGEIWKDVKGAEGYAKVSNLGRIKSSDRVFLNTLGKHVRYRGILIACRICNGYEYISITTSTGRKNAMVHRFVAEAFIPNSDGKPFVNHIDCNKRNNQVNNLEWCTHLENITHAKENNRHKKGSDVHRSKLTEEQVHEIREKSKNGYTYKQLKKEYNVGWTAINGCVKRITWKHI